MKPVANRIRDYRLYITYSGKVLEPKYLMIDTVQAITLPIKANIVFEILASISKSAPR